MQVADVALAGMAGWTGIGAVGTLVSLAAGQRRKAWRGIGWMAAVWAVYVGVLLGVSRGQAQRVRGRGQEECFGTVCFSVAGVAAVGEFKGAGGGRLVTVAVRMVNRSGDAAGVEHLRAYLVDEGGRRWGQTVGLGGVALATRLPAGGSAVSAPVFRVEGDAGALGLVLTRGWRGWGWLRVGDTDSLLHRPTLLRLQ